MKWFIVQLICFWGVSLQASFAAHVPRCDVPRYYVRVDRTVASDKDIEFILKEGEKALSYKITQGFRLDNATGEKKVSVFYFSPLGTTLGKDVIEAELSLLPDWDWLYIRCENLFIFSPDSQWKIVARSTTDAREFSWNFDTASYFNQLAKDFQPPRDVAFPKDAEKNLRSLAQFGTEKRPPRVSQPSSS